MKTIIQGKIKHPSCIDLTTYAKQLNLLLFSCTLVKEQKIQHIPFDKNGDFRLEIEGEKIGVQYLVKLMYGEGEKQALIRSSAKLCTCKTHELSFYFDPKRNEILLPYLVKQLHPHLEKLTLANLDEEQVQQLVCLSKEDIIDIRALQQAEIWNGELRELTRKKWLAWEGIHDKDDPYFKKASVKLEDLLQEEKSKLVLLIRFSKRRGN